MTKATPAKLRNGSWGARVEAAVEAGDTIQITTRSGKTWKARVMRVLWSDGKVSLCVTESAERRPAAKSQHEPCAECGERAGTVPCLDSSGIRGLCCSRCARMSRWERSFG